MALLNVLVVRVLIPQPHVETVVFVQTVQVYRQTQYALMVIVRVLKSVLHVGLTVLAQIARSMEEYVLTALVRVLKPVLYVGLTVLAQIAHKTVRRQIRCVLTVLAAYPAVVEHALLLETVVLVFYVIPPQAHASQRVASI
jgi:hypothetical protein